VGCQISNSLYFFAGVRLKSKNFCISKMDGDVR
jgi:hypothetical protein